MIDPWLDEPVTTAAYGWRVERRDGVTIGFTSHDKDVEFEGLLLRASPGLRPSTIVQSLGLEADAIDIEGALTSDEITESDLEAGRWDGAAVSIFLFDWSNPSAGSRPLASGQLGSIRYSGTAFEAELLGAASGLDRPVGPLTSPTCRAEFCGAECGLNRQRFATIATVANLAGDTVTFAANLPGASGNFSFGKLRWLDGPNCGLTADIVSSTANSVRLVLEPLQAAIFGARAELVEGCSKTLAECATRFSNAVNFRGEPHLPGNDLLTRYPGAG